ncbi:MAG: SLBB domain-containing protein [Chloroflexi bacterium]|nr:SLBB domain-containing protein [Chloroflexota bacterium]
MAPAATADRLLAGPQFSAGAESFAEHRARLGPLPIADARNGLIDTIERSGLLGRGGAGFPVGRKWRSVGARSGGRAAVVANGAEGEPRSAKDRSLMTLRPHLVIDGAILAAAAVGADDVVLYVGMEHRAAVDALVRAVAERPLGGGPPLRIVEAPMGYIAGESSAMVHYLEARDARPMAVPPRPHERGLGGRPTLIQNVESLAAAALIARHGDEWFRATGRDLTPGTALVTVTGPVAGTGVREIEYGTTLRELVDAAGGLTAATDAVLLGGYFGGWAATEGRWDEPLDPASLSSRGLGFGCGMVAFLPADACGVWATSRIMEYMAGESARQCGPCIFGLGAISGALRRLATGAHHDGDLADVTRWAGQIAGRGACHHPDGAAGLLQSGLRVFADEFALHERTHGCSRPTAAARRV